MRKLEAVVIPRLSLEERRQASSSAAAEGAMGSPMAVAENQKQQKVPTVQTGSDTGEEQIEKPEHAPSIFEGLRVHVDWPEGERKTRAIQDVLEHGGDIHKEPDTDTTHLVTAGASSKMRLYAKKYGIHMVVIDWLEASLASLKVAPVSLYDVDKIGNPQQIPNADSTQASPLGQESVRAWLQQESQSQASTPGRVSNIFRGLQIAMTSGGHEERGAVCSLIQQHGGVYDKNFADGATHLIAFSRKGRRWQEALERQPDVKIVSEQWLRDCIESGERRDEGLYIPLSEDTGTGVDGFDDLQLLKSSQNSMFAPASNQQHAKRLATETPSARPQKRRKTEDPSPLLRHSGPLRLEGHGFLHSAFQYPDRSLATAHDEHNRTIKDSQETFDDADSISTQTTRMSLPHESTPKPTHVATEPDEKRPPPQSSDMRRAQVTGHDDSLARSPLPDNTNETVPHAHEFDRESEARKACDDKPSHSAPSTIPCSTAHLPTPPRSSQSPNPRWSLDEITIPNAKKIYAVRRGYKPGFYWSYEEANQQTLEFSSNLYRSFKNSATGQRKAVEFMNHSPDAEGVCPVFRCSPKCKLVEEEYAAQETIVQDRLE
ncbi:hypothetical protein D0869_06230 [Hortaea werneckii]|uniref:BRCT domain-containing protein n=1 Tax=Hortaea werneckii TaxID=91943 RepID=A0A3M6WUZ6_HORWE|nr:hypothetical protein KC324_g6123 [Hortaea werneckii]KAI7588403.1 hypothetical protein KC316_g4484 [Hortaea werneckii]RMX82201.1 hypothetical protein D0869_06230 [Hortaea werneckii]RMY09887.1 hypothetical protein D0868_03992 [Hortaea werneckii]